MNKSLAASVAPDTTPAQMPPVLRAVISASRSAIASAAMFSLFLNLLMLVPSIYMLQVYDRVLSTGSVPTLLMLTLITTFLFIVFGGLEWLLAAADGSPAQSTPSVLQAK